MHRDKVILSLRGISLSFKGLKIFENLSVDFVSGKVNVIVGENGSGKTTLFNLISGLLKPQSGKILLNAEDITSLSFEKRAKMGIVRSFQEAKVFRFMNTCDNGLFAFRYLPFERFLRSLFKSGKKEREYVKAFLREFNLEEKCFSKAGELSLGNQRLLNLLTVLNTKGKVFLLDEPLAGINEVFYEPIIKKIKEIATENLVIVIEHSRGTIEVLEGRIYKLERGRIFSV